MKWCPIIDEELEETYLISPLTGNLLVVPKDDWDSAQTLAELSRQGLTTCSRVSNLNLADDRDGYIPLPHPELKVTLISRVILLTLWYTLSFITPILGPAYTVATLKFLARFSCATKSRTVAEILDATKLIEGEYHGDTCLVRSLMRYFLLRHSGIDSSVALGVFPPTSRMHAWVVVSNVAVGEEPDELMHYQPALLLGTT